MTGKAKRTAGRSRGLRPAALGLLVLPALLIAPGPAQTPVAKPPPKTTAEDWAEAIQVVRQIALDASRPSEQRANAVLACARMQLAQGKPAEALKTCWDVFDNPKEQVVAQAAARAACFVTRQTSGHLAAQLALVGQWEKKARGPASKQALRLVRADLARAAGYLMGKAGKRPTPAPMYRAMPGWGRVGPRGPKALSVALPRMVRPRWMTVQPGRGLPPFQITLPVAKPSPLFARDNKGVPKPLILALPVYTPPRFMPPDKRTGIPSALVLTLPAYRAPAWYRRVQFPLLKAQKK